MNLTWDLEILYKGYDDPKYQEDVAKVMDLIKKFNELVLDINNPVFVIEQNIKLEEELTVLISELFSYSSLRSSTNVNGFTRHCCGICSFPKIH